MIARESLIEIGRFAKPHGINGELTATIDYEGLETTELKCIFCEIDGIPVPFFVESERQKGVSVLLTIDGISDERQASMLSLKQYTRFVTILRSVTMMQQEDGMPNPLKDLQ